MRSKFHNRLSKIRNKIRDSEKLDLSRKQTVFLILSLFLLITLCLIINYSGIFSKVYKDSSESITWLLDEDVQYNEKTIKTTSKYFCKNSLGEIADKKDVNGWFLVGVFDYEELPIRGCKGEILYIKD